MNVRTLITRAQEQAGRVDAGYDSRTLRALNDAQEKWALTIPWPTLVKHEQFVASGAQNLILPPRVRKVRWVMDRTNKRPVDAGGQWDRQFPSSFIGGTVGQPGLWRELGHVPVTAQPSTPGYIHVVAPASDNFNVHISGLALDTTASGTALELYQTSEILNVTASAVTSVNQYSSIDVFGKDELTTGDLVLYNGSAAIARVPRDQYVSKMRQIELLFKPTAGTLLEIEYLSAPPPLSTDPQVPHPAVDTEYLVWYAAGLVHRMQNQADLANEAMAQARRILTTRIQQERSFGDDDWQAIPDQNYWGTEDIFDF